MVVIASHFLAESPHRAQPIKVHIRILENKKIGNRITVVTSPGVLIHFSMSIT
jgi:hypothetical protein